MGNIPVPFANSRLNSWTPEKKLLILKTISMSACIVGTVIYLGPIEPYLETPFMGILVPTFMTGYIIIHSSDIFLLVMGEDYIFLIGAVGSLVCGICQLCKWIKWKNETYNDPDVDYNTPELVLALAFFVHFVCLTAVIVYRVIQRMRINNNQESNEN